MSVKTVREYLEPFGFSDRIIEFSQSSATVREAAEDLGTEEGRIAKSMSFLTASGPIIIVLAGDRKIDNRKFKDTFHEKARMIGPEDVEELTGHRNSAIEMTPEELEKTSSPESWIDVSKKIE